MNKKTVRDVDVAGKRVLVRVDFNVPIDKATGEILDDTRIRAALPTIAYLRERGARVILVSHLGRPDGEIVESMRLLPVARAAAALLGAARVDAVDVEPVSVRQATENLTRNGVEDRVRIAEGSAGEGGPFRGTYDLVLANIIARILIEISAGLVAAVKPGGTLILSGIIEPREADVVSTFTDLGLRMVRRAQMEDWVAQVWTRPEV